MKNQMSLLILIFLFVLTTFTVNANSSPTAVRIQAVIQDHEAQDPALGGIPSSIYYILVDENGRPLTDVNIEESTLRVTLDGETQGVVTSSAPNTPLYVAMTLDVSTSMDDYQEEMVAAVTEAIESAPDSTHFGLLTFDHAVQVPERFLLDRHQLGNALRDIEIVQDRYTCLYDAANEALLALEPFITASPAIRRAAILFTDGANNPAPNTPCAYDTLEDIEKIIEYAQEKQIAIYTISFGNKADQDLLDRLAQETGGLAFTGDGSMEQNFSEVMRSLNNQHVVNTTLFPETAGKHTLTLHARVSGEGQTSEAIEAGSVVIETIASPILKPTIRLVEHNYMSDQQRIVVTLEANNAEAIDCLTLKLRDMEIMETIESRKVCSPSEGRSTHNLENLPKLVDGRPYRLEIDSQQEICPTEESAADDNPCVREFSGRLNLISFSFEVQSQPQMGQLQVALRELDIQTFPWVKYRAIILQEGVSVSEPFEGVLNHPARPFTLPFYPAEEATSNARAFEYDIQITLTYNDVEGITTRAVTVPLRQPPSLISRIGNGVSQRPFLTALLLLVLLALPLLYFGRNWLEKQLPGTRYLLSRGVIGHASTPVKPVTQLPEAVQTETTSPFQPQSKQEVTQQVTMPSPTLRILQIPRELANEKLSEPISVDPTPFRIGREGCHLTVGDDRTSRTHATIQRIGRQYFITDMGSTNGTYLNDEQECLAPNMRWPLTSGDYIRLGTSIKLVFTIPEHLA